MNERIKKKGAGRPDKMKQIPANDNKEFKK
jgi:hypothetical protein